MTKTEYRLAVTELCKRGFLTCTRGRPGEDSATYALSWLPLDEPERFPAEIRRQHEKNMRRILGDAA